MDAAYGEETPQSNPHCARDELEGDATKASLCTRGPACCQSFGAINILEGGSLRASYSSASGNKAANTSPCYHLALVL